MMAHLREAWGRVCRNPLAEALLSALFLLASLTGILLGPAALCYLWHHNPQNAIPTPASALLLSQRLQGSARMQTAFWLGLAIWVMALLPLFASTLFGLPIWFFAIQPLWLAIAIADRFDLPLALTLRATVAFIQIAPAKAFTCMGLGLLGFLGICCFGIGLFITLPVATRALMTTLDTCALSLAAAIQRATR